jgi:phage tail-like protein
MNQPLAGYHFQVEWGGARIGFTEVSGLDVETEILEYREGSSPQYSTIKIPGLRKHPNLVLKRGVMRGDNEFFQWLNATRLAAPERRDLLVALLNEEHEPTMVWKVRNAWPVKIVGPVLNALEGTLAIEALEIAHEGLTVENG